MLDKLMFFYHIFTIKVSLLQIINTRKECIQNKLVQVGQLLNIIIENFLQFYKGYKVTIFKELKIK